MLQFHLLDMQALGRLAQVCRWLRRFTSCDLLWRRIARASLNSGFTRLGTDLYGLWPQAGWGSAYTPSRLKTESGPLLSAHCSAPL